MSTAWILSEERQQLETYAALVTCNPFSPKRRELEQQVLGDRFDPSVPAWNLDLATQTQDSNLKRLIDQSQQLLDQIDARDPERHVVSDENWRLYVELVSWAAYHRFFAFADSPATVVMHGHMRQVGKLYRDYEAFIRSHTDRPGLPGVAERQVAHLFALSFQVRRAFILIFGELIGTSEPMIRLREAIWQSIFTHDEDRYRRSLYNRMGQITTLITGPSGTGKELVARSIALARYVPFDPQALAFSACVDDLFLAVNLSALSPTLIESELFGHVKGAFTGAAADRAGWFETCPPLGTVFLDEIGELDPTIQVKLLRVLQTRSFQRAGDTQTRTFDGKVIAATNCDLGEEIDAGRFRPDFYYRLCADVIRTPKLREQIDDRPEDLTRLVHHIANRLVPDEADAVCEDVMHSIRQDVGDHYEWPGNIRELEQCVLNVLVRRKYQPRRASADTGLGQFLEQVRAGELTCEQLLNCYVTHVYHQRGTYEGTARHLGIDRRTVKARVDAEWLKTLAAE